MSRLAANWDKAPSSWLHTDPQTGFDNGNGRRSRRLALRLSRSIGECGRVRSAVWSQSANERYRDATDAASARWSSPHQPIVRFSNAYQELGSRPRRNLRSAGRGSASHASADPRNDRRDATKTFSARLSRDGCAARSSKSSGFAKPIARNQTISRSTAATVGRLFGLLFFRDGTAPTFHKLRPPPKKGYKIGNLGPLTALFRSAGTLDRAARAATKRGAVNRRKSNGFNLACDFVLAVCRYFVVGR